MRLLRTGVGRLSRPRLCAAVSTWRIMWETAEARATAEARDRAAALEAAAAVARAAVEMRAEHLAATKIQSVARRRFAVVQCKVLREYAGRRAQELAEEARVAAEELERLLARDRPEARARRQRIRVEKTRFRPRISALSRA